MAQAWKTTEQARALNLSADATLSWRDVADTLAREGFPARDPEAVSVRMRRLGAPRRTLADGRPCRPDWASAEVRASMELRRLRSRLTAARAAADAAWAKAEAGERAAAEASARVAELMLEEERLINIITRVDRG